MGTLHKMFPASPELKIYPPLDSSPEDEFEAFTISDDSLSRGTIYQGDIIVIKLRLIQPSGLHVASTPAGIYAGFPMDKGNGLISIECNDDEYESEIFKHDEIEVLGRVVQVYPGGDIQERWELIRAPQPAAQKRSRKA